ncbi:MAG: VanZ family protein [Paludibacteraceae bacterium]|mgnify:CR=1 FL=1|jgi:VanZ family protein|nr:VanZ family protein [Paludibacteraceae bacterium]OQA50460.1 MAG: VanZ like family protein [Bacteroidetes bacterium ADurb.Bin302]HPG54866.1 VanZ family protein [Candidatus Enterocola sp.]
MNIIKAYWKTSLISIIIIYLSMIKMPSSIEIPKIPYYDKWVHLIMYALLCTIVLFDSIKNLHRRPYIPAAVYSIILGGILELLQILFPPRSASFADFLANLLGCSLSLIIFFLIKFIHGRTTNSKNHCINSD